MIHSQNAVDLIKVSEGKRNKAYPDPASGGDPWTIGYGHTGPEVHEGLVWTDEQCLTALNADLLKFDKQVSACIGDRPTTQNQFDAFVDFAYNLGSAALAKSTLLKLHNLGDFAGASDEFARWNRAGGRPMPGLTKRRAAETALYRSK